MLNSGLTDVVNLASGTELMILFQVFGPAFRRQSRWSVAQPVPDLAEDDAEDRVVDKFYKFWFGFKSWREFPHPDEEDIEQAEGRDHRSVVPHCSSCSTILRAELKN